jgi:hypothetical protein
MKCALPICLALLIAGCSTGRELGAFDAASSEKALVRWQRKGKSLVYDGVCARAQDGSVVVRLYKQSPVPMVEFRLDKANTFSASGRLAGRGWTGPATDAPAVFSAWIWFLTAYQRSAGAQPGAPLLQSATMRVSFTKSGDKLKVLSVSNTESGEVVSAIFD